MAITQRLPPQSQQQRQDTRSTKPPDITYHDPLTEASRLLPSIITFFLLLRTTLELSAIAIVLAVFTFCQIRTTARINSYFGLDELGQKRHLAAPYVLALSVVESLMIAVPMGIRTKKGRGFAWRFCLGLGVCVVAEGVLVVCGWPILRGVRAFGEGVIAT